MTVAKRQRRSKYDKIQKKHKILFLRKVIQQKQPLKKMADMFKINYSTAKTLVRKFRIETPDLNLTECQNDESFLEFKNVENERRRCNYKQVQIEPILSKLRFIQFSSSSSLSLTSDCNDQLNDRETKFKKGLILKSSIESANNQKNRQIIIISKILFD